ncbi:MAG: glycosyltransferase [Pseudomonadota bacterium]
MRITVLPDWRSENPYQQLLADALNALSVECTFPEGYRRVLPISRSVLPKPRPDLLHLHWPSAYLRDPRPKLRAIYCERTLIDLTLVRKASIPVVWTVHNLVSHDTSVPMLEKRFSRRLAHLADALVVHSMSAQATVISELGVEPCKTCVIPHGSLSDAYGPAPERSVARTALGLPTEVPVALFFGMIRPYKGVVNLLRAWDALVEHRCEAILFIAGKALDEKYGTEVAELAAQIPSVRLDLRFVPDSEVPLLMAAADLFVVPFSQSLTSGTVRLAQDYDLPVVAPRLPGTADEPGIMYVDGSGIDALGETILEALNRYRDRPRVKAKINTWNEIASKHASLYQRMLRSVNRPLPQS